MTPRSRKPVLLVSGTNINSLTSDPRSNVVLMDKVTEESIPKAACTEAQPSDDDNASFEGHQDGCKVGSLTSTFKEYLHSRNLEVEPTDHSFSSRTDDYSSMNDLSPNKMSASLLQCLNGDDPPNSEASSGEDSYGEKKLVLKPKQFDENGQPTVYETSF